MESYTANVEAVNTQDILSLATWNNKRSTTELRSFISRHEDALDVEDFNLD